MENSGFKRYSGSLHSPLLCYRFVSTTLTMQIPTETLSQSHMVCLSGKKETQKQGFPTSIQKKASRIKILRYKSRN